MVEGVSVTTQKRDRASPRAGQLSAWRHLHFFLPALLTNEHSAREKARKAWALPSRSSESGKDIDT